MKAKLLIIFLTLLVQIANLQSVQNQNDQTVDPIVQRLLDDLSSNADSAVTVDPVRKALIDSIFASTKTDDIPTATVSTPKVPISKFRGCGFRNVGGLESGMPNAIHDETEFGEFPWMVVILDSRNTSVGAGSLIHPKIVLTANHKVRDYANNLRGLKVRAGEWDAKTTAERLPYQEQGVSRIFAHPAYNHQNVAFDVALIELANEFQLDDHINIICLPPPGFVSNQQNCFASGWGNAFNGNGKNRAVLKKVPLGIVEFNKCESDLRRTLLGQRFHLDPSFICAGGVAGIDTCQGDGGAPLVCPTGSPEENRYVQNGIVAWGVQCKQAIPAVYANVAVARMFIDDQMEAIGLSLNYLDVRNDI